MEQRPDNMINNREQIERRAVRTTKEKVCLDRNRTRRH